MRKSYARFLTFLLTSLPSALLLAQEAAGPSIGTPAVPGAKPPASPFMMQLPMMIMIFGLLYFVLIAPQKKQQKQIQEFQKGLSKGDEVVTTSGIIGKVAGLNERVVTLEISPGTEIKMLRNQVNSKLNDLKNLEGSAT
jgi:preprotein translocase subunit YajC